LEWLQTLATEFPTTASDPTVWLSIGEGLLFGAVCLVFGVWVARFVGLLERDAPAGETIGVGLGSGLLVLAAWWAAIASGGRSSFTPVAVGFVIALGLAAARSRRPRAEAEVEAGEASGKVAVESPAARSARRRDLVVGVLGGAVVVLAFALLYGSTMAPSARDGGQPIEFMDEAYYSILGADLAKTGTETIYSPSGFSEIQGLPTQTWYHWGEAWLAAAVITIFGTAPLDALHFIVLPLMLLAAAALTGTLVRRVSGFVCRGAFLFGFLACLFLAPVPFISGPYFSSWAVGLVFGITMYGIASVAVLLAMFVLATVGRRPPSWPLAAFVGSAIALILPAHLAVGMLAVVGAGSVWAIRDGRALLTSRRLPVVGPVWRRTNIATAMAFGATVGWGVATGHGIGTSGLSPSVAPFNASWGESIAITVVCSGALLAIAFAWFMARRERSIEAGLYLGAIVILDAGAVAWGALLGDFTTFHLFFAGIAVFATPVAAVAVWSIASRLRADGHPRLGAVVLILCLAQLGVGVPLSVGRLQFFGPHEYDPVPVAILIAIEALPSNAKLAYACQPSEELAFWDARLLSLEAHTGRRLVPMCFQAEFFGMLTGTQMSPDVISPLFRFAPQRLLYPDSHADPSVAAVTEFLTSNGIGYIYADTRHPNSLVPDAIPIATSGTVEVLRIPEIGG
jgi:hypothetical protein